MTECRYCRYSNGTWVKSLQKTTYACREGHDTKAEHCDYFDSSIVRIMVAVYLDHDIENIYEGSIQDTWA